MERDVSFGKFVKQRRLALGLTQAELATRVGCATITARRIEAGTLRPSTQIAERLAMALDIPADEQAAFVRLARTATLATPEPPSTPTPPPLPEEIGEEDLSGRAVRGFELAERLGAGGFGAVYRAVQPGVGRDVAVKIILPRFANHPDFIRRFESEAQLVARLEHPHIIPLYDFWRDPGAAYLVMRLLRGGSLKQLLQDGPLPLPTALRLLEQVGAALHSAHRLGVIHRDLKPSNILLDQDHNAYLSDFGIAKNLGNPDLDDHTQTGAWMGSPAYISPEQIRAESIRPQTDIYCLGVLIFEMLTGRLPFDGPTPIDFIMQHLNLPLPPLSQFDPALPESLQGVMSRATSKDPNERYPDIPHLLADLQQNLSQPVDLELAAWRQVQAADGDGTEVENPFKGLRAFLEADAGHFFGREGFVQKLLSRLAGAGDLSRFLAAVGPSGSGKSSLVKAGLVPALRRGGLPGSEDWFIVDFTPGSHPFEELEAALLRVAVNPPESLLEQLKAGRRGLLRAVKRILPQDPGVELVLVIDQFEELFTLVEAEDSRATFLECLVEAVLEPHSRLRVVVTMRADFTDRPLQYVDFGELMEAGSLFVLPLSPDELERAVTGPASQVGLVPEPGLAARIIREIGQQPGSLPLLQYALTELFERRDGRRLTLDAYEAIGGVLGALGGRAEQLYAGMADEEQAAARQLFLRLVTLGEGVEDTRRRVLRSELAGIESTNGAASSAGIDAVLERFGRHRLLTFDHDPLSRRPTVEVAHEALLREWPRLRAWLDHSRTDIRMQRTLAGLADEWRQAGRDPSFILRGARLDQFTGWAEATSLGLTAGERAFLDASLAERRQRQAAEAERQAREQALEQRSRNFLRALVGVFAVATVVAVLLSLFAFDRQNQAQANAELANQHAATATVAQGQALVQADLAATSAAQARQEQAVAEQQADARATQQSIAEEQRVIAEQQQAIAEAQTRLATSRELSQAALLNLEADPELSILLAMHALSVEHTRPAEEALHQAVQTSRVRMAFPGIVMAYSPDGKRLATLDAAGTVWLWDLEMVQQIRSWSGHSEPIASGRITYGHDGTLLATAGDGRSVKIWGVENADLLLTLFSEADYWETITFSPNGTHFAASSSDGTVFVWEISTALAAGDETAEPGLVLDVPSGGGFRGNDVQFHPDGSWLLTSSRISGGMQIWDLASGELLQTFEGYPGPLAISADGRYLASALTDFESIAVLDLEATISSGLARELSIQIRVGSPFNDIALSPDGTMLAGLLQAGATILWNIADGTAEEILSIRPTDVWVDFNQSGNQLAASRPDGTVALFDITPAGNREVLNLSGHAAPVQRVTYSHDGTLLATAGWDGTARLWDAVSGEMLFNLAHAGRVWDVDFSLDDRYLATAVEDNTARVWRVADGAEVLTLTGHEEAWPLGGFFPGVTRLAFSPTQAELVATAGSDGMVHLWDITSGELLVSVTVHPEGRAASNVVFSPDGSRLITTSDICFNFCDLEGAVGRIWEAATGELLRAFDVPNRAFAIAFSQDASEFVAAGSGGFVNVWDAGTGDELHAFWTEMGTIGSASFLDDGERLIISGFGLPTVLDLASGEELLKLPGHESIVIGMEISPDGRQVATASHDGTARVSFLYVEDLLALAQTRVTRWFTAEECQQFLHTDTCPPAPWEEED